MTCLTSHFYSVADLEKITGLSRGSLYVTIKRLVDKGVLIRPAAGIYCLFTVTPQIESIAASLYLPNYLSFESSLSRYGILNLIPYTLTFATTRKTKRFTVINRSIEFRQIKKDLYWGYEIQGGIYVASPEKGFLDLVYLASRGVATIDLDEIDTKRLSIKILRKYLGKYPSYTQRYIERSFRDL